MQDHLVGRNFTLEPQGAVLTLAVDLTSNFNARKKTAAAYSDAINLVHNHHRLRFLECNDNLLRGRLIRAWDRVQQPELRLRLELGGRGSYLYRVAAHSLFTGGIHLEVQEVLGTRSAAAGTSAPTGAADEVEGTVAGSEA